MGIFSQKHQCGQLVTSTKTAGTGEVYVYDKTGNRIVGSTVVGKNNRILNDGKYAFLYDGNGNLTRRTTLVSGAPIGAYVQYSRDHHNQLTKVEFYNAAVNSRSSLPRRTFAARRTHERRAIARRNITKSNIPENFLCSDYKRREYPLPDSLLNAIMADVIFA